MACSLSQEHLGFVPPPSACVFCPYRGVDGWRELRDTSPEDFAEVIRIDDAIRDSSRAGVRDACYLSNTRTPVEQAINSASRQGVLFDGQCDSGNCWT